MLFRRNEVRPRPRPPPSLPPRCAQGEGRIGVLHVHPATRFCRSDGSRDGLQHHPCGSDASRDDLRQCFPKIARIVSLVLPASTIQAFAGFSPSLSPSAKGRGARRASRAAGNLLLWERRKSRWSAAELSVSHIHHSKAFVRCAAGSFLLLAQKKRTKEKGLPRRSTSAKPVWPGCSDSPILGSVGTRRTSLCVALRVWKRGHGFVSGARQIDGQSHTPNFIVPPANVGNQIL